MRTVPLAVVATLALSAASSAFAQSPNQLRDTGSMAYPSPLPQGNYSRTTRRGPADTGSAAYPAPLPQGNLSTTATTGANRPTDTGNMAYPAPAPAGNTSTTTVK